MASAVVGTTMHYRGKPCGERSVRSVVNVRCSMLKHVALDACDVLAAAGPELLQNTSECWIGC